MSTQWLEVWIDSSSAEYVLVVRPCDGGGVEVFDPQENWRRIERFSDYESAVHWLNEDEYDLVEGRLNRDDDVSVGVSNATG